MGKETQTLAESNPIYIRKIPKEKTLEKKGGKRRKKKSVARFC